MLLTHRLLRITQALPFLSESLGNLWQIDLVLTVLVLTHVTGLRANLLEAVANKDQEGRTASWFCSGWQRH